MKMRDLIDLTESSVATCPKCRGKGEVSSGHPRLPAHKCRACDGTGEYPSAERIASLLNDRQIAALTGAERSEAADHRDGMVMTSLSAFGLIGFPRSGDNACPWSQLGKEVVGALREQGRI